MLKKLQKYDSNLYSADRNRTVAFYLENEKNAIITNVNWTADFGDGKVVTSTVALNPTNEPILVIVEHNYSSGGDYDINATSYNDTFIVPVIT